MAGKKSVISRLKLFGNRVLVQRDEAPTTTESGKLTLPDSARTKRPTGTVIAMAEFADPPFAVGARVLMESFAGTEFDENCIPVYDRDGFVLLDIRDIAGVIADGA